MRRRSERHRDGVAASGGSMEAATQLAAIEGNGRQYCPGPNKRWARQFPSMFNITDGSVGTGALDGIGLGF